MIAKYFMDVGISSTIVCLNSFRLLFDAADLEPKGYIVTVFLNFQTSLFVDQCGETLSLQKTNLFAPIILNRYLSAAVILDT